MMDMNDAQLRRLDAGLLLVFEEVLRTGNLSKASGRLRLTPSAISHALARLRDIFGDPLFLRRPQGVVPTRRALTRANRSPGRWRRCAARLIDDGEFRPASIDRLFQIAALDALIVTLAPKLLARLAREAPDARLAFRSFGHEDSRKAVREGRADLALGVFETPGQGMITLGLGTESFVIVARKGHPLFRDGLSLENWLATDHIVVSAAGDLLGALDPVARRARPVAAHAGGDSAISGGVRDIAAGDATASVPESLAKTFAEPFGLAVYRPPIDLPPFELTILRARAEAPDPALDWLVRAIVDIRRQLASSRVGRGRAKKPRRAESRRREAPEQVSGDPSPDRTRTHWIGIAGAPDGRGDAIPRRRDQAPRLDGPTLRAFGRGRRSISPGPKSRR